MGNRWRRVAVIAATALATACAPLSDNAASEPRNCTKGDLTTLYPGIFTVGTDRPAYPPWYVGDDPTNGEGFESALAYAVAGQLGYGREDVRWVRVPFNGALEPGPKTYDANLSQFSITDQRRAAVDFSSPYFDVTQVVVTTKTSPAANVRSMADLKKVQLGVQVGTTSHTAAIGIEGDVPVEVYNTNADAKVALISGEIDALVADLPTAFAVAGELRGGTIVGQLPPGTDDVEQFGIVLDKDSSLTRCVSSVVDSLRSDGTLRNLERDWLADAGKAPVLN
ncbi:ABC transporter substrate-binding protein [Mycolicibacterium rhodesiae]|nr:transporter substrate-binding domain-containing protein [Mycolicibacterium rhodesiae]